MMMRAFMFGLLAVTGFVAPALAYENFIPLGTGYSTEVGELTELGTEEGEIRQRADEHETEIYFDGREAAESDSRFRQFFSDAESTGADSQIDY
jgi:hypothetical protein